jgi:deazaflavin-dependent oxidoreductase (nitroreductase family)
MEHGIPGSEKAEIATLEHVGRKSGTTYFTPVHPTIHEETVLVPAPLGVGSQWARNVLDAGRARLQFHETLYELDQPELITVTDAGMFPPQVAGPFDRMGWRYLRMHRVAEVPGTFATHKVSMPAVEGHAVAEPPLEGSYKIPVEPRMVERPV